MTRSTHSEPWNHVQFTSMWSPLGTPVSGGAFMDRISCVVDNLDSMWTDDRPRTGRNSSCETANMLASVTQSRTKALMQCTCQRSVCHFSSSFSRVFTRAPGNLLQLLGELPACLSPQQNNQMQIKPRSEKLAPWQRTADEPLQELIDCYDTSLLTGRLLVRESTPDNRKMRSH